MPKRASKRTLADILKSSSSPRAERIVTTVGLTKPSDDVREEVIRRLRDPKCISRDANVNYCYTTTAAMMQIADSKPKSFLANLRATIIKMATQIELATKTSGGSSMYQPFLHFWSKYWLTNHPSLSSYMFDAVRHNGVEDEYNSMLLNRNRRLGKGYYKHTVSILMRSKSLNSEETYLLRLAYLCYPEWFDLDTCTKEMKKILLFD